MDHRILKGILPHTLSMQEKLIIFLLRKPLPTIQAIGRTRETMQYGI